MSATVDVPTPGPATPATRPKRPTGLTVLALVWIFFGVFNLYSGFTNLMSDVSLFPLLSTSHSNLNSTQIAILNWLQNGLPADAAIQTLVFFIGILQVVLAVGFLTARRWSYRAALIPVALVPISWISQAILYSTAPSSLSGYYSTLASGAVGSLIWIWFYVGYFRKPYIKEYLLGPQQPPAG